MTSPFTDLPDLASRDLGGSVGYANDEFFAEKENLIKPARPTFAPAEFGLKGKVYDGWETRRRREPGHDHAIVRLGCPGIVHGIVVDTAYFTGNYPPEISIEAARADAYPSPPELATLAWHELVPRSPAQGDSPNSYPVGDRHRWTHIRLSIYPDGGVARLRVHGEIVPDPAFLTGTIDLAAIENGARVTDCSNAFYSAPSHLLMPGRARDMSDGWENSRRRDDSHDYVEIRLAGAGYIHHAEIDTTCFVGNAPGWIRLTATDTPDQASWRDLLPRTRVQPDTRHRFRLADKRPATHVRLDVIPDGGLSRLRLHGELTESALAEAEARWRSTATATSG
ncbi:MAG TPA: allantoicase [Streptosporangiaceae bacterium]|jgi:allantoicase|nr:allantoicase [Streptosporangiaceae bacterium]